MRGSKKVLSDANGPRSASVMFIGEAPGRLGAELSLVPFHGDRAGDNFESLLTMAGFDRSSVFITNAVLCNPRDESGRNATPSDPDISNCSAYLSAQIEIVNPKVVVTLGAKALDAVSLIETHDLKLNAAVRKPIPWNGRILMPLYHPGQRAMVHRSYALQTADYYALGEYVRRMGHPVRPSSQAPIRQDVAELVKRIIQECGEITYFALHKLMFLVEYESLKKLNSRLTTATYIRQKDGPYCVDISLGRIRTSISGVRVIKAGDKTVLKFMGRGAQNDLFQRDNLSGDLVSEVVGKLRGRGDADLKRAAYLTRAMRNVLSDERRGINRLNSPVLDAR